MKEFRVIRELTFGGEICYRIQSRDEPLGSSWEDTLTCSDDLGHVKERLQSYRNWQVVRTDIVDEHSEEFLKAREK